MPTNTMKKIIIWLFEKYCYDYWADIQGEKAKDDIMKENDLKSEEEYIDFLNDQQQEPLREAYYQGKKDGYNQALKEN